VLDLENLYAAVWLLTVLNSSLPLADRGLSVRHCRPSQQWLSSGLTALYRIHRVIDCLFYTFAIR